MDIGITDYEVICNLGVGIEEVYQRTSVGDNSYFELSETIIKGKPVRVGRVDVDLPEIKEDIYNTRCNRLILKCLQMLDLNLLIEKYGRDNIAVVVATTNTGVEEHETSGISNHFELGNPAEFIAKHYGFTGFYTTVSTACSSGIKAFSIARDVIKSGLADSAIVIGVDSLAKVALFGFDSLGVLSPNPTTPFCTNREGINIGEGIAGFVLEKDMGIKILGIGETTDVYHATCPDPEAKEAIRAIKTSLSEAQLKSQEIDYINLHGTGTVSNDLMEANAINSVFGTDVLCSSTKSFTGHCLGAAAAVEIALCCKLLESDNPLLYPNIYEDYDSSLPDINLVKKGERKPVKACLCTSFGFGGTNTAIVLGGGND